MQKFDCDFKSYCGNYLLLESCLEINRSTCNTVIYLQYCNIVRLKLFAFVAIRSIRFTLLSTNLQYCEFEKKKLNIIKNNNQISVICIAPSATCDADA